MGIASISHTKPWRPSSALFVSLDLWRPVISTERPGCDLVLALSWSDKKGEDTGAETRTPSTDPSLDFRLGPKYTPPAGHALRFDFNNDPPDFPALPGISGNASVLPWGSARAGDRASRLDWSALRPLNVSVRAHWRAKQANRRESLIQLPCTSLRADNQRRVAPWKKAEKRNGVAMDADWRFLAPHDIDSQRASWSNHGAAGDQGLRLELLLPYLQPPVKEPKITLPSAPPMEFSPLVALDWCNPPAKERPQICPWGPLDYDKLCRRAYQASAGTELALKIGTPLIQVGDLDHITLFFDQYVYDRRCLQRPPSGWRDVYFYQPRPLIPAAETRRYYQVLNTVLLTRLPDRAPIEALELRLRTDMGGFCWQMQARLASSEALDLLRNAESAGEEMRLEVSLNGWQWIFILDGWTENRRFSGAERRISGRSASGSLAAPAAPLISLDPQAERSARQLAEETLEWHVIAENATHPKSWELDWQIADWLVPAGAYSRSDCTAMHLIRDIADAASGLVQTHPSETKLLILPRYARPPWQWSAEMADIIVPKSMLLAMEGRRDPRAYYNAAFVSGTAAGGISAKLSREGTAGDLSGPMFTHPLITDVEVARARALGMLAASGEWRLYRLTLPLFPRTEKPGLLLPGTLMSVSRLRGQGWTGQVTASTLQATLTRGGVLLRQILDVERYCAS